MTFQLTHSLIATNFTPRLVGGPSDTDLGRGDAIDPAKPVKKGTAAAKSFVVNERGTFDVLVPGRLDRTPKASFEKTIKNPPTPPVPNPTPPPPVGGRPQNPGGGSHPPPGGNPDPLKPFEKDVIPIPLTLRLFTPDGREFTKTEITKADLERHRDRRGVRSGPWSYTLTGKSEPQVLIENQVSVANPSGSLEIAVVETVPNASAPPLIDNKPIPDAGQTFKFDLFRVGTFTAEISLPALAGPWRGTMTLFDHQGAQVAKVTRNKRLTFEVGLAQLRPARSAGTGLTSPLDIPKWRLEVRPTPGTTIGTPRVTATVIATGRMDLAPLKKRIDALLGRRGANISLIGANRGGRASGRLIIKDIVAAETIDMFDLLNGFVPHGPFGRDVDIVAGQELVIADCPEEIRTVATVPITIDVATLRVSEITVSVGPSVKLTGTIPSIGLSAKVEGAVKLNAAGKTIATAKVRSGVLQVEVGMRLSAEGTPRIEIFVPEKPLDFDIKTKAELIAALFSPVLAGALLAAVESAESSINRDFVEGAKRLLKNPEIGPRILMSIFGAHFTYRAISAAPDAYLFNYVAPEEPETRPTPGYHGAVGRSFTEIRPGAISFASLPPSDTWSAGNLAKIDHIVVVMMENRSYDHVLGHRNAQFQGVIDTVNAAPGGPFKMKNLEQANFPPNSVSKKRTRLPFGVGHSFADVAEQLNSRFSDGKGGQFNSPLGFVTNFEKKIRLKADKLGVEPSDALGFYDGDSLPFFKYLADHYAFCPAYFSSHPGPTLPNRMYSLAGDVQYDRHGFAIIENNAGDNFLLARQHNIYDFLVRGGITFRVYESAPSVTMLRMFARYATDNVNIVPIGRKTATGVGFERLAADVASGDLPQFTVIEPSMHHHPQNDDHPDADMHRGQIFLSQVYKTLRSNAQLWEKTLLIITYDEHGGLYDHVVPPVADVFAEPHSAIPPLTPGTKARVPSAIPDSLFPGPKAGEPPSKAPPGGQQAAKALPVPYGVRVPTFVVTPLAPAGKGEPLVFDHCSILKTVLARFLGQTKPFMTDRVEAAQSFDGYLTEVVPRRDIPDFDDAKLVALPLEDRKAAAPTTQTLGPTLSRRAMRAGPVDYHELTGRWARQLGR